MLESFLTFLGQYLPDSLMASLHYLTSGKHLAWYASLRYTLGAALLGAALAVLFGLAGAAMKSARFAPLRAIGHIYTTMVRGVPDVLFFLFFPLAFEQAVEYFFAQRLCSADELAAAGSWPPCQAAQWYLGTTEYFILACVSLGLVYGAFAANVIHGAMQSVPAGQIEAARAYGFSDRQVFWRFRVRQMWVYALPGLSNVWMLLLKATSLLSLLQIADIVQWAERLGAPNYLARVGPVHPDWRWKYYMALFVFYILLTMLSEWFFRKLQARAGRGILSQS
ncbi:ABC transporter permease subunit [Granulosicoccaceae sp. 1_MG-2023]|nr:ABC transporter permease subunit [Granulosicoccaceae sp. 1_MG-2023]